jgi:hypothetical protein
VRCCSIATLADEDRAVPEAPDDVIAPRGWWARSLLWALGSFASAVSAYPLYNFAHVLHRRGLAEAGVALLADFVYGASALWAVRCAAVAVVLLPAFLAWGLLAPRLRGAERTWAGVAAGTALFAALAVGVGASFFWAGDRGPVLPAALVAWAALLLPRRLCRALQPGAFVPGAA